MSKDENDPLPYDDGYGDGRTVEDVLLEFDDKCHTIARQMNEHLKANRDHSAEVADHYLSTRLQGRTQQAEGKINGDKPLEERGQRTMQNAEMAYEAVSNFDQLLHRHAENVPEIFEEAASMQNHTQRELRKMVLYKGYPKSR